MIFLLAGPDQPIPFWAGVALMCVLVAVLLWLIWKDTRRKN